MAIDRFSANFRTREDMIDQITPYIFVQDDIRSPAGPFKPAAWLPVQWTQSNRDAGTDAFVCSVGKVVAFDSQNRIVPAGLRTKLGGNAATGAFAGTVLSYGASDVTYKVTDLVTGDDVSAAVDYTGEQVCDALIERGWVSETEATDAGATIPVAADADVNIVIDLFISKPIGISNQDIYVWSGKPEDGDQKFTNYSKQQGVSYTTEVQLVAPMRCAASLTNDDFVTATLDTAGSTAFTAGAFIAAGEYWNATNAAQLARYENLITSSSPVVALGLAQARVASNTDRTPFTCDVDGVLVRERTSASLVTKAGDYFIDGDVGVLFIHEDTWDTQVADVATITFSYHYYTDTGVASAHRFLHFDGHCKPGDFVVCDSQSNLTVASSAQLLYVGDVLGRVSRIVREPRTMLDKVKTAWTTSGMSAYGKMPGTATKGYSALITFSGEDVADKLVEVVFRAP